MVDIKENTTSIHSVTGHQWRLRPQDERDVLLLTQRLGIPDIVARILIARGIAPDDAESFLKPTLREFLPDPFHLKDMDKAVERVASEIVSGQRTAVREDAKQTEHSTIAIFGDYDVDGATSSALLMRYFAALGLQPLVHIPDRMKEGYGPNTPALLALKAKGADVIITVDCGTLAFEPLKAAKDAGLDVIVLDHHKGEPHMPECYALVNPNRFDESSEHTQLAAVGVTFLFLVGLSKRLKEKGIQTPDLLQLLDIVALGTICDVVPLTGLNRALVSQGLKIMAHRQNTGLTALMDAARLDEIPTAYHAGFVLGPRINAGGRVGESSLGVRLLTTEDPYEASEIASRLGTYNEERKAIEAAVLEEAMLQANEQNPEDMAIVVASSRWHPGVIGIVASRIKDVFHKPTAIIALSESLGKASARSVSGIDIGAAVIAAHQSGILLSGGGHAMAAGFSVAEHSIPALRTFFNQWMKPFNASIGSVRSLLLDGVVAHSAMTPVLARSLEELGPFGAGNPSPRLMISNVKAIKADVVGQHHVRVILTDVHGGGKGLKAMAFRAVDSEIGKVLLGRMGTPLHVAGQMKRNFWQGVESAEFVIDDVAIA